MTRHVMHIHGERDRAKLAAWCARVPDGWEVEFRERNRTLDQNARLWAMLGEISAQVDWHGQHLSPEDWKAVFTASQKKQRAVPGIDGGFVVLGNSTSKMTVSELSELLEIIAAFGAQQGVKFSDPQDPASGIKSDPS